MIKNKYDFIIDGMTWSFSRANAFKQCPYAWKQIYIYSEKTVDNAFGEFGTYCHLILEKYFKGELEKEELARYFADNYYKNIFTDFPSFPKGMEEKYCANVYEFFKNFNFDKENYEIMAIEEELFVDIDEYKVIIKPDLRLRNKKTNEIIIIDYKTSNMTRAGEIEKDKNQIAFYSLGVLLGHNLKVNKGQLWFLRYNEIVEFEITNELQLKAKQWFKTQIKLIEQEINWNKTPDNYFCKNLCGVRNICKKGD